MAQERQQQRQERQQQRQERQWIQQIWRRHVPIFVAPGNLPPVDFNSMNQYTFNQLVTYMGHLPHLADQIFEWGRSPAGLWSQHEQFYDENALIAWHANRAPGMNFPLSRVQINANTQGLHFPIDQLIYFDKVDALSRLHQAGHWDPLGYTASGESYLYRAAHTVGARLTLHYILSQARHDPSFARRQPVPTQLTTTPDLSNHLDLIIRRCEHTVFTKWWHYLHITAFNNNDPIPLTTESQRTLCSRATNGQASQLRITCGINIAQVNLTNQAGSVWHLALDNPNTDIMDFLRAWAPPNSINLHAGFITTPLETAMMNNRINQFKKLLAVGAECDVIVRTEIGILPDPRNKWIVAAMAHYKNINPPPPGGMVQGGTLIHTVINALYGEYMGVQNSIWLTPPQKARRRKVLVDRAKRYIQLVREGSRYGRPDLTTRNEIGETARDLAHRNGFPELQDALQINPLPQVAQGGNPPAPARGHRYPTRRAARLRGT